MELETLLTPFELLEKLQQVERQAGRERKVHWGPRTLDLDLLLYDDCVIDTETLTVPHPDMQNRDFVLAPLCEIAPFVRHPSLERRQNRCWRSLSTMVKSMWLTQRKINWIEEK